MSTIDKGRYIEPSGPATFEQDGWYPGADQALDLAAKEFSGGGWSLLIWAGVIFLVLAAIELFIEGVEWLCPACFGH